ncbi:MAG: DUF222 domain-containing protein [Actinomycetota bacterium]
MRGALTSLDTATVAVGQAWAAALSPLTAGDEDVSLLLRQMDDGGLLTLLDSVTALGRRVDALTAAVAAEVAGRSPLGSREDSLAHRKGFASPGRLVAASSGGTVGRAAVLAAVGRGTATRQSLQGEVLPALHPHLAAVVRDGAVSVEAAHLIITMLNRVAGVVAVEELDRVERVLTEHATWFPLDLLVKLVAETEALLNPDGVAPREEVLRQGRSLVVKEDKSGRIVLKGAFDPETGAPIKAALDAIVERALRAARGHNHPGESDPTGDDDDSTEGGNDAAPGRDNAAGRVGAARPVMDEMRSVAQIRADGLADIARHVLGCEDRVPGLPVTTVVVHMDLEDMEDREDREGGRRFATIDGVDQPISAATARRLACAGELIPAVFGGPSLPLDLGRVARLFSRAQTLALWGRDGGCASCGQTTFVEAHHIHPWEKGGRTDLCNGVLLCSRCHHRVHRHDWGITIDPGCRVWFIPPAWVDPDRRPRPGVQRQSLREKDRHTHDEPPDETDPLWT